MSQNPSTRSLPIVLHQFSDPGRLPQPAPRPELHDPWLQVEHRRAVDCVAPVHMEPEALDPENPADRGANRVGPVLRALREDTDTWPGRVVSRMARLALPFAWRFESGSNLPLIRPDSKRLRIGGDPRALSKELLVSECLPALWTARTTFSAGPRLPTNRSSPPHSSMILNSAVETHTSENDFEMSGSPDG